MSIRTLLPCLLLVAATPLLMAEGGGACDVCGQILVFHDELRNDIAWHEVELRAGQHYLVETVHERGMPTIELVGLDGEVQTACANLGWQQTCGVVASEDIALGILVDSSAASSEVVIQVRPAH